jgi:hypothetical protein
MKKSILTLTAFLMPFISAIALDLTDVSNDMAFPAAKSIINSNNSLLEVAQTSNSAAIVSLQAGVQSGVSTTSVNNLTVTGSVVNLPAGVIASSALVSRAELITSVTASIATNANGGTNVVTFTAKDINGTAATYPVPIRFWISDDGQGTPAAVAGDVAISSGVELQQVVDKADYWIISTNLAGTVIATITDTPGGTNYIHVAAPCGRINKYTSAFRAP